MKTHTEKNGQIKTTFLKDWQPFEQLSKQMERKIIAYFMKGKTQYQTSHNEPRKSFKPVTFAQIDNLCGFAYTSTSSFAGLWICNGVNLWADDTRRFYGFAITESGDFYALAEDENEENELIIKL